VADGPYRKPGQQLKATGFLKGFGHPGFRAAAFGYFGHMWELYAFWVFVPVMLNTYKSHYPAAGFSTPLLSFFIIAAGAISCACSGILSQYLGAKKTAALALVTSCFCCLISPLLLLNSSLALLISFLFVWSVAVIADSPLFSTLVAQNAPPETKGTSLTIVNCIGFAITIVSIQLITALLNDDNARYVYILLAIGPVLGLIALLGNRKKSPIIQ
jgi:predicted MFS family arabinose efflux permease